MKNAFVFAAAAFMATTVDCKVAHAQQAKYFADVTNSSCIGSSTCTFSFPPANGNSSNVFVMTKVSCRIVITTAGALAPDIIYAVVSKSSSPSAVEFLPHTTFLIGSSNNTTYYQSLVDANTLYFVQPGVSPTVTINAGTLIGSLTSNTDQPTCSVSGFQE